MTRLLVFEVHSRQQIVSAAHCKRQIFTLFIILASYLHEFKTFYPSWNVPIKKNLCNAHIVIVIFAGFAWMLRQITITHIKEICSSIGDKDKHDRFFGKRFVIHEEEGKRCQGKIKDLGEYHFMDEAGAF